MNSDDDQGNEVMDQEEGEGEYEEEGVENGDGGSGGEQAYSEAESPQQDQSFDDDRGAEEGQEEMDELVSDAEEQNDNNDEGQAISSDDEIQAEDNDEIQAQDNDADNQSEAGSDDQNHAPNESDIEASEHSHQEVNSDEEGDAERADNAEDLLEDEEPEQNGEGQDEDGDEHHMDGEERQEDEEQPVDGVGQQDDGEEQNENDGEQEGGYHSDEGEGHSEQEREGQEGSDQEQEAGYQSGDEEDRRSVNGYEIEGDDLDEARSDGGSVPGSPAPSGSGREEPSSDVEQDGGEQEDAHSHAEGEEYERRSEPGTPRSYAGSDVENEVDRSGEKDGDEEQQDGRQEEAGEAEDEEGEGTRVRDIFGDDSDNEEGAAKPTRRAQVISDSEDEGERPSADQEEGGEMGEEASKPEGEHSERQEDQPQAAAPVDSDDEDDRVRAGMREDFVSDFDAMMDRRKAEQSRRRRKKRDYDLINDSDDLIAEVIAEMKQCADEDRELNAGRQAATKKLKMLPQVLQQLRKQDLKNAFLDAGVLNVITDWLAPLPDRSLPHLHIREGLINILIDMPAIDPSSLKSSGVGKAIMYLFKHPKETKENRQKCGRLIGEWARPIFNVSSNLKSMSREERESRDFQQVPKRRRTSTGEADVEKAVEQRSLRPGEKGWIPRARVPMPSTRDYVNRPKWAVEGEMDKGNTKTKSRLDKHLQKMLEKKRSGKQLRAISISVEGRKMPL